MLTFELGDPSQAARWFLEALEVGDEGGTSLMSGLPMMALIVFRLGSPVGAATILGAHEGFMRSRSVQMPPYLEALMASRFPLSGIRDALSPADYEEARSRGLGMRVDEVIALASEAARERGVPRPSS